MYKLEKHGDYLLLRLRADFDFNELRAILHHVMSVKEYPHTNDIWLIGHYRADIRLGELETLAREFQCRCPRDATRSGTAIVVDPGLTEAIVELWVSAVSKKLSFEMEIFHTFAEARAWLQDACSQVA